MRVFSVILLLLGLREANASKLTSVHEQCDSPNKDTLLALVNKERGLDPSYEPTDLIELDRKLMSPGRTGMLRKEAAEALAMLLAAASEKDFDIRVRSAYRSYQTQRRVFRAKVRKYGQKKAKRISARPGHSQHQLGTTVDLTIGGLQWKISQRFGLMPEGKWLADNAHLFGFSLSYPRGKERVTGYIYEPWHLRYVGHSAASGMRSKELTQEEYLRQRMQVCESQSAQNNS
jgi:D-alanyl-D-alanine carboxypeptidase